MFDHVDIRVSDLDASQRFYDTVLNVLDKPRIATEEGFAEWGQFSIHADRQPVTQRLHVAFFAPHELVDAFHRAGVEAGFTSDGALLLDPDGNGVEAVYVAGERELGQIDHLWLRVADVETSTRFYATIAPHAGLEVRRHAPDHTQLVGRAGSCSLLAGEPTVNAHIAFPGDDAAVDAFHATAIAAGYRDNGAPGKRPQYSPGYYGAFVLDPDGNNVEVVAHNR